MVATSVIISVETSLSGEKVRNSSIGLPVQASPIALPPRKPITTPVRTSRMPGRPSGQGLSLRPASSRRPMSITSQLIIPIENE